MRGEGIERPVLLLPAQLHRVEGPADIVPIERADESLVAVTQELPADLEREREVFGIAKFDLALAQVERVVTFRAERARKVGAVGIDLPRVLTLRVDFQPVGRA